MASGVARMYVTIVSSVSITLNCIHRCSLPSSEPSVSIHGKRSGLSELSGKKRDYTSDQLLA